MLQKGRNCLSRCGIDKKRRLTWIERALRARRATACWTRFWAKLAVDEVSRYAGSTKRRPAMSGYIETICGRNVVQSGEIHGHDLALLVLRAGKRTSRRVECSEFCSEPKNCTSSTDSPLSPSLHVHSSCWPVIQFML